MASFALALAPALAAAEGLQQTLELGANAVEVRLQYAGAAPGSTAIAGEGSVGTRLPGEGQLTLRVPHVVGETPAFGTAQLAASYDLAKEGRLLPNLAVVARVDLPTAHGARGAFPGVRATAAKRFARGPFETLRVETDLWTSGPQLTPSYRTLVGATFHLRAATSGSLDFIAVRPAAGFGAQESLAQLGLSQTLGATSTVRFGVAAGLVDGSSSLRATLGLDHRF